VTGAPELPIPDTRIRPELLLAIAASILGVLLWIVLN
jgi:hypothetical protein